MIQYQTIMDAVTFPDQINKRKGLQAAIPSFEITRLYSLLSGMVAAAKLLGIILIIIGGLSIFTTLSQSSAQKAYDIALLRAKGAKALVIFTEQIVEGLIISLTSIIIGIFMAHAITYLAFHNFPAFQTVNMDGKTFYMSEVYLALMTLFLTLVAVLWPAVKSYRIDPIILLNKGR